MDFEIKKKDMLVIAVITAVVIVVTVLAVKTAPTPISFIGRENLIRLCMAEKRRIILFAAVSFGVMSGVIYITYSRFRTTLIALRNAVIGGALVTVICFFLYPVSSGVRSQCEKNGYKGTQFMKLVQFIRDAEADIEENDPAEAEVSGMSCSLNSQMYTDFSGRSTSRKVEYVFYWGDDCSQISRTDAKEFENKTAGETVTVRYYKRSKMLESVELNPYQ